MFVLIETREDEVEISTHFRGASPFECDMQVEMARLFFEERTRMVGTDEDLMHDEICEDSAELSVDGLPWHVMWNIFPTN